MSTTSHSGITASYTTPDHTLLLKPSIPRLYSPRSLPSLSYASSSNASLTEHSPRLQALADSFDSPQSTSSRHPDAVASQKHVHIADHATEPPDLVLPLSGNDMDKWQESTRKRDQHRGQHKTRLRVDSNPPIALPRGFPYRNSAIMMNQYLRASRAASENSSDEVDLDLSFSMDHVGIDMSQPTYDQESYLGSEQDTGQLSDTQVHPVSFGSNKPHPISRSKCRSSIELRHRASPASLAMTDYSQGWSFNATEPLHEPLTKPEGTITSRAKSIARGLKLGLVRSTYSMGSTQSPTMSNSPTNPSNTSSFAKRYSRGTDLTSPKTPLDQQPAVLVTDEGNEDFVVIGDSDLGEFGRLAHLPGEGSYHTAPDGANLKGTSSDLYYTAGSMNRSGRLDSGSDVHGLGFSNVGMPDLSPNLAQSSSARDHNMATRPPLSPTSVGSPSPNSPLLGADSGPAIRFDFALRSPLEALAKANPASLQRRFFSKWHYNDTTAPDMDRMPGSNSTLLTRESSSMWSLVSMPSGAAVVSAAVHWLDDVLPAKLLFYAAFLFGPWLWVIGGFFLRYDGEFYGTRGGLCRCHDDDEDEATKSTSQLACPADIHRALRLMGAHSTGLGFAKDAQQEHLDGNRVALLNVRFDKTVIYVRLCRLFATLSGAGICAAMAVAIWAVVVHF